MTARVNVICVYDGCDQITCNGLRILLDGACRLNPRYPAMRREYRRRQKRRSRS